MIESIDSCVELLKQGEVIALPTETVYGLAARIDKPASINQIFALKQRPNNHPLIVHVSNRQQLESCVKRISDLENKLIETFWPGPLTLLFEKSDRISDLITAGSKFVAVRMPAHEIFLSIIERLNIPLAAPSANTYQQLSPTTPEMVQFYLPEIGEKLFNGGKTKHGLESTIVMVDGDNIHILRKGAISKEEIKLHFPNILVKSLESNQLPATPGNIFKHYSPRTPLVQFEFSPPLFSYDENIGLLSSNRKHSGLTPHFKYLDFKKVNNTASQLFENIWNLDKKGLKCIYIQKFPAVGIGNTINDRLIKACRK